MAGKLHLTYPPNVSKVTAQRRRAQIRGLGLYHLPFVFLYFFSLRSCVETSGVPYQTALAHHKSKGYDPDAFTAKAADVKKPKVVDDWGGAAVEDDPWADLDADEGEDDASASASAAASAAASTVFVDENGTIVNATTADAEEQITYETPPTLPAAWLPEFYAVAVFSVIATTHVLLCFAQHWSVKFRAFMNYRETDAIKDGSYLMFVPMPHQGKAEIVRVNALEIPDADAPGGVREMLWTTFQRQRFEFVETERGGGANGKARGEVREVLTPVANALSSYVRPTRGLTPAAVAAYVSRYGDNSLRVPLPTFMQVYKEQLMGPVTVFQVFTVLLWLMDEYWKYAIFSAASLLLFEGTTAFSKIKNIRTLRGMGQAPGRVNCLRDGRWEDRNTEDLVPGDIVSIVRVAGGAESPIPCDCLVLRGSAVVNEASLTGESVPQMKDALSPEAIASDPSKPLDIDGEHKVNVLYSGTTLMQQSTGEQPTGGVAANLPKTPDGGCLCYVLQTGFSSTQGKLMRMMEFSSEQVTGDTWETLVLLFILLVFACVASGHVFVVGLRDGKRSQYELVLRCILILTSVVPPELPMQTAMAVNTALLALMKAAVFCTEPFRVPISGKVDTCLFDKTGTLTSDQLVAVGRRHARLRGWGWGRGRGILRAHAVPGGVQGGVARRRRVPLVGPSRREDVRGSARAGGASRREVAVRPAVADRGADGAHEGPGEGRGDESREAAAAEAADAVVDGEAHGENSRPQPLLERAAADVRGRQRRAKQQRRAGGVGADERLPGDCRDVADEETRGVRPRVPQAR